MVCSVIYSLSVQEVAPTFLGRGAMKQAFPTVEAIVEIPRGSRNKYEIDHTTGTIRLDRVLFSSVHYPAEDERWLANLFITNKNDEMVIEKKPVEG